MIKQVLVIVVLWSSSGLPFWAQPAARTSGGINDGQASQEGHATDSDSLAAQVVSDTDGVSIEELVNLMLSQNKQLEAARTQLRQAEARLTQARLRLNPSLDVEHGSDVFFANEGERAYNVALSHAFELGGKRAKRIHVANAYSEVIKAQIADAERQFATRVRLLFGEAIGAAAQLDQLEQVAKLNQEMVRIMKVRLDSGDAARLDRHLLLATTNQLEVQWLQVQSQLAGLLLDIKTLIGLPPEDRLVLRRAVPPPEIGIAQEAAVAMAFESRQDLRAARLREALAESEIELAKVQAVPNITASARYTPERNIIEGLFNPADRIVDSSKLFSFGISIPLPLFNRQQGNIAEAVSLRTRAHSERLALEQAVRRDVLLAYQRWETARRSLEVYERTVLPESRQSFQIVQLSYRLGESRLLDVISQQRLFLEAQSNIITGQKTYYAAFVELESAIGRPVSAPTH